MKNCPICGFKHEKGILTEIGQICERDFYNPYLFLPARKLSNFSQGKIKLDCFKNRFAKNHKETGEAALKNRTKMFLEMDEAVFTGTQKTL